MVSDLPSWFGITTLGPHDVELAIQSDDYNDAIEPATIVLRISFEANPEVYKDYDVQANLLCNVEQVVWNSDDPV